MEINTLDLLAHLVPEFVEQAPEILVEYVTTTLISEDSTLYDVDCIVSNIKGLNGSQDHNILAACLCLADGSELVDGVIRDGDHVDEAYMEVGALCDTWGSDGGAFEHVLRVVEGLFDGVEGMEREDAAVKYWSKQRYASNHYAPQMAHIDTALEWLAEALEAQTQKHFVDRHGTCYRPVPYLMSDYCCRELWGRSLGIKALRRLARVGAIVEGRAL